MVLLTEERLYIDSNRDSLNKKTIKTFVCSTMLAIYLFLNFYLFM